MPISNHRHEHVQFSIRTLFIVTTLAAVVASICRYVVDHVEHPLPLFAATALGMAVGLVTFLTLREVPINFLLGGLASVFVLMNGFWIRGTFAAYGLGIAAGALLAWRGIHLVNQFLSFCGFTISTVETPLPISEVDENVPDKHSGTSDPS